MIDIQTQIIWSINYTYPLTKGSVCFLAHMLNICIKYLHKYLYKGSIIQLSTVYWLYCSPSSEVCTFYFLVLEELHLSLTDLSETKAAPVLLPAFKLTRSAVMGWGWGSLDSFSLQNSHRGPAVILILKP